MPRARSRTSPVRAGARTRRPCEAAVRRKGSDARGFRVRSESQVANPRAWVAVNEFGANERDFSSLEARHDSESTDHRRAVAERSDHLTEKWQIAAVVFVHTQLAAGLKDILQDRGRQPRPAAESGRDSESVRVVDKLAKQ